MLTTLDSSFFFFNDTATTEIYTLSLHDALPILLWQNLPTEKGKAVDVSGVTLNAKALLPADHGYYMFSGSRAFALDRKSTRLNSSHQIISYAVFCLKKKKSMIQQKPTSSRTSGK